MKRFEELSAEAQSVNIAANIMEEPSPVPKGSVAAEAFSTGMTPSRTVIEVRLDDPVRPEFFDFWDISNAEPDW